MPDILKKSFDDFVIVRNKNIELIKSIHIDKLKVIPKGLNNNIYWQTGHILTVQASLLYNRTNQDLPIKRSYLEYFGKGTSPNNFDAEIPDIEKLVTELSESISYTESNYNEFASLPYDKAVTVSTGHILTKFSDALSFLSMHESYHFGSMSTLKRLIGK